MEGLTVDRQPDSHVISKEHSKPELIKAGIQFKAREGNNIGCAEKPHCA